MTEELRKPIIRKFKVEIILQLKTICRFNKRIRFLLCVTEIFSKYAWVVPLKDKRDVIIINAFQNILNSSKRKPNKIWVDKDLITVIFKIVKKMIQKCIQHTMIDNLLLLKDLLEL